MFSLIKRKAPVPLFPFGTDMHSHLLPGVDDGASGVEASLGLIAGLRALGYRSLVTTPHVYSELYPNTPATLAPAFATLQEALTTSEIPLRYAAEYFLDDYVDALLQDKNPLLCIYENWVLVETSFVQAPLDLDRRLFDVQLAGYKPILAHPERYPYWHLDRSKYHDFREKGLLLQVNLLSLTGYYGKAVADTARYLVKEEMVDLVGTDCHHERHIAALQKGAGDILRILEPLVRKDKLLNNHIF
ncbi:tyrosine-protein phosphatase [Dinghuibacter silviterrae]|uniref:protein-tyrosine-phosphatase n=1 Tax=Dinghuibacter silviterrae TaxID=1539049 RepID=A0A4V3GLL9_9BACT|nr:CpsB/CapC family capsule biosynthesis tyrosine phosphatase [Dinghuibacter silviterrae]TDX00073.1 tyrosine-protein phosphatase YwqE [Dinghuibacter silviterrae]